MSETSSYYGQPESEPEARSANPRNIIIEYNAYVTYYDYITKNDVKVYAHFKHKIDTARCLTTSITWEPLPEPNVIWSIDDPK